MKIKIKFINVILFWAEINLFFLVGFFTARGEIIRSIVLLLLGISVALFLGNKIYSEGNHAVR